MLDYEQLLKENKELVLLESEFSDNEHELLMLEQIGNDIDKDFKECFTFGMNIVFGDTSLINENFAIFESRIGDMVTNMWKKIVKFFKGVMQRITKFMRKHIDNLSIVAYDNDGTYSIELFKNAAISKNIKLQFEEDTPYMFLQADYLYGLLFESARRVHAKIHDKHQKAAHATLTNPSGLTPGANMVGTIDGEDQEYSGADNPLMVNTNIIYSIITPSNLGTGGGNLRRSNLHDTTSFYSRSMTDVQVYDNDFENSDMFKGLSKEDQDKFKKKREEELKSRTPLTGSESSFASFLTKWCSMVNRFYSLSVDLLYNISDKAVKEAKNKPNKESQFRDFITVRRVANACLSYKNICKPIEV